MERTLKLSTPLKVDGQERTALEYDLDVLTGRDLQEISRKLKLDGVSVSLAALDFDFELAVFCRAVTKLDDSITQADLLRMGARDTMQATGLARTFLLASDPVSEELLSGE